MFEAKGEYQAVGGRLAYPHGLFNCPPPEVRMATQGYARLRKATLSVTGFEHGFAPHSRVHGTA